MNLIDILKNILSVKNEIRDILNESDKFKRLNDFSRLPIAIHNYLVDLYNEGYVQGYGDTYESIVGVRRYTDVPLQYLEYNVNSINYSSYELSSLVDIMRDVLNYRIQMKDEDKLNIDTDYFPDYPDYLRGLISITYDTGYTAGQAAADNDILPSVEVDVPDFTFDSTTNTFYIESEQEGAKLWWKIGPNGVPRRYSGGVMISEDTDVYYYAVIGMNKSDATVHHLCEYNSIIERPTERKILPPDIHNWNNRLVIDSQEDEANIEYSIDDGDWEIYRGPIDITDDWEDVVVRARNVSPSDISPTVSQPISYVTEQVIVYPNNPQISKQDNQIVLSCTTEGADIYYSIDSYEDKDYVLYTEPFTISKSCNIYCYSVLDGVESLNRIFYPVIVRQVVVIPEKVIFDADDYRCGIYITCTTGGSHIHWRYGNDGPFNEVESNWVFIEPPENCIITAYSSLNGNASEMQSYEYNYYSNVFILNEPVIERIGNRIVMSCVQGNIYYTIDTGDGESEEKMYSNVGAINGIPITRETSPMVIRARCRDNAIANGSYHSIYSKWVTKVFYYDEDSFSYSDEYCTVFGASEINVVNAATNYSLSYSYDKINWTPFNISATGLDPTRYIYLKGSSGNNGCLTFTSIYFGQNDQVVISGNIMSLMYSDGFSEHKEFYEYTNASIATGFEYLFKGCSQLIDAQNLVIPIERLKEKDEHSFDGMFDGCINLVYAPKQLLFNELNNYSCRNMFRGCTSLTVGPEFNFTDASYSSCESMFEGCINLEYFHGRFNIDSCGEKSFKSCFKNCEKLRSVDFILKATNNECCVDMFSGCSTINGQSIDLQAVNLSEKCYQGMFFGCSSMTDFNNLPASNAKDSCYYSMFEGCSSLKNFGNIGCINLDYYAMKRMFYGCSSLEYAPVLSMYDLNKKLCLEEMFCNCSSLKYIKALFLTDPASGYYTRNWVKNVNYYGTFVQDDDALWDNVSDNGIPIGWSCANLVNRPGNVTVVNDYDRVYMTSSNGDDIYYQINDDDEDGWILYTGEFTIDANCWIYAKCINARGKSGEVVIHKVENLSIPGPVISNKNNFITISNPTGYEYEKLYYKLSQYHGGTTIQDYTLYTEPIPYSYNLRVSAKGLKYNGEYGDVVFLDCEWDVSEPEITCENNVVTIVGPTEDSILYWRYSGESGWRSYTAQFTITEDCVIECFARLSDGMTGYVDSDVVSCSCYYDACGESYSLETPILFQQANTNNIVLKYNNIIYYDYPNYMGQKIRYKIDDGPWIDYTNNFQITSDCTIQVQSYLNSNIYSGINTYNFTYISGSESIVVPDPVITVVEKWTNAFYAIISNSNSRAQNQIRLVGKKNNGTLNVNESWRSSNTNGNDVTGFIGKIYARSYILDSQHVSHYSNVIDYDYNGGVVVVVPIPVISVSDNYISITCDDPNVVIKYSYDNNLWIDYTGDIQLSESITIYAKCLLEGHESDVVSQYCEYEEVDYSDKPFTVKVLNVTTDNPELYCYVDLQNYAGDWIKWDDSEWTVIVSHYSSYKRRLYANTTFSLKSNGQRNFAPNISIVGCEFLVEGNICSLIDNDYVSRSQNTTKEATFYRLFSYKEVINAENLIFPITQNCSYRDMFYYCQKLIYPPKVLPATTLKSYKDGNYYYGSYHAMFSGCTSMIKVPDIKAVNIDLDSFGNMFNGCTNITTGPILRATVLPANIPDNYSGHGCYNNMFSGCTKLNYIKSYAITNISQLNLYNWVENVGNVGLFEKAASAEYSSGNFGIPSGWTIRNISS